MIDVPVRVKDALRDGRLRKNYVFKIYRTGTDYVYEATITRDDTYFIEVGKRKLVADVSFTVEFTDFNGNFISVTALPDTSGKYIAIVDCTSNGSLTLWSISYSEEVQVYLQTEGVKELIDTIDNDTLVKESVKFDERMCSGNKLLFGLCEGSSLEFQYFNHQNINGLQIEALISVQYEDEYGDMTWHTIPMGWYTVSQCPMQFSTGIYKVTAYNKLRSDYLDEDASILISSTFSGQAYVNPEEIKRFLLTGYRIESDDVQDPDSIVSPYDPDTYTYHYQLVNNSSVTVTAFQSRSGDLFGDKASGFSPYNQTSGLYPICNCMEFHYNTNGKDLFVNWGLIQAHDPTVKLIPGIDLSQMANYEYLVWNFIKNNLTNALSNGGTGANAIMSAMLSATTGAHGFDDYYGWHRFCGIRLTKMDDTYEYYSDIAYSNSVAGVTGSITSLQNTLIDADTYKEVTIYKPYMFGLSTDDEYPSRYLLGMYEGGMVQLAPAMYAIPCPLPNFLFNDGSLIMHNSDSGRIDFVQIPLTDLSGITLRDLISATYEVNATYGKLDRETDLFAPVELNGSRLLPADNLYPADTLYPNGNSARANKSMYQKLWTDSQGNQKFRYLYITYKGLDANNQEVEKVLQRTVNADGTTDYNMSDNWLFKNLVWSDADVGDYADAMVLKMKDISWFPFEMWCAGLPYIETGDELEITNSEGTYTSYVLQRQLNGIQNLQDTFIDGELDIF